MEAPPLPGNLFMHSKAGNICHSQNSELFMRFTLDDEKEYSGPDSFRNVEFKPISKLNQNSLNFMAARTTWPAIKLIHRPRLLCRGFLKS